MNSFKEIDCYQPMIDGPLLGPPLVVLPWWCSPSGAISTPVLVWTLCWTLCICFLSISGKQRLQNSIFSDCCHWEGITCDKDGRVTHLLLPSKRLQGSVSHSLGNLTHLSHLNLSHNQLSGLLEAGLILSLSFLEILDLSYNLLSGEVPLFPPSSYIRIVDLSSNQFNGTIPSSFLQHAGNLSSLNVSKNHITGQMPSSICLYSSLVRVLDFSYNDFSGSIPLGLGTCSKLEVFHAGFNSLSGTLPSDIYNAQALEEISLPSNKLFGPISDRIVNLPSLTIQRYTLIS
ncbi:receptor-like protein 2 [Prunus yedoensis var. nudiflora]|uniref:Receptor-like protein 2 n=1 Tax=Prunus yedoensis var. nudiflora TaxID=2094558 RepID=A0A314Z5Y7_PRUYE|nr:receptor-like protein 2 [Prunus yedoensis var. nudiflora]